MAKWEWCSHKPVDGHLEPSEAEGPGRGRGPADPLISDSWCPGLCKNTDQSFWASEFVVAGCDSLEKLKQSLNPFPISGVPNLRGPWDLRWSWCDNIRNKVHNKWSTLELSQNHPSPSSPVYGKTPPRNCSLVPKMLGTPVIYTDIYQCNQLCVFSSLLYEGLWAAFSEQALFPLSYLLSPRVCLVFPKRDGKDIG